MKSRLLFIYFGICLQLSLSGQLSFNIKRTFTETNHQVIFACYNADGKYIVTGGSDNNIIIWNAETGIIYRTLTGLKKRPNAAALSPQNEMLVSAGEDNIITFWNPATSHVSFSLSGHTGPVNALDISPDGRFLASGSSDKTIRIWDINTRTLIFELRGHKGEVTSLKYSPDGKTLVSGGADKMIILWNPSTGSIIKSRQVHTDYIRKVTYSPDGSLIASCGDDKMINICNSPDLTLKTSLKGHTDWVQTIDFSPDGKYLMSGGHDQLIIMWDVVSGKIISQSEKQGEKVVSVDFCPVRPDFISAVVLSEKVETWALSGPGETASAPSALKSLEEEPLPVMKKEDNRVTAERSQINKSSLELAAESARKEDRRKMEESSVSARMSKSTSKSVMGEVMGKSDLMKEEVAMEKNEMPVSKEIVSSLPLIQFFDPLPMENRIVSEKKSLYLIGRVTGPDPVNSVLINKNLIKLSEAGVFEYNIPLVKGENQIELIAISTRGKMSSKLLVIECTSNDATTTLEELPDIFKGRYFALLIGVNDYKSEEITDLDKPIKDAESLYNVLNLNYTFEKENIIFLKNPALGDIINTFDKLGRDLTTNDNLLIFYAGHGSWDEKSKIGYWYPSDADKNSSVNWFRNSTLRDFIGSIQAKHTMLIADACFSGAIFKTRGDISAAPQGINTLYDLPSRKAMTSGTEKLEVPDESVFMKYLVERLSANKEKFLPSEILFSSFKAAVMNNSPNVPQYGVIQNVGDEGGDFIFIKR
jgi:WD40 repeat protein